MPTFGASAAAAASAEGKAPQWVGRTLRAAGHHPGVLEGDVPGRCTVLDMAALCKIVFTVSCSHQACVSPCHRAVSGTEHTLHSKTEAEEPWDAAVVPVYIFQRKEDNNLQSAT